VQLSRAVRPLSRHVYLLHCHHDLKCALGFVAIAKASRDLPWDSSLHQPQALVLSAIANYGVPIPIRLLLILGGNLKREGLLCLKAVPPVRPRQGTQKTVN
jgi:hypothetical protein